MANPAVYTANGSWPDKGTITGYTLTTLATGKLAFSGTAAQLAALIQAGSVDQYIYLEKTGVPYIANITGYSGTTIYVTSGLPTLAADGFYLVDATSLRPYSIMNTGAADAFIDILTPTHLTGSAPVVATSNLPMGNTTTNPIRYADDTSYRKVYPCVFNINTTGTILIQTN